MLEAWEKGWACLLNAIESLKPEDLSNVIYIRNEGQTVLDAIQRQLAHYPHHVGQILFQAKALKGSDFKSLSIPKGASADFNAAKFLKKKRSGTLQTGYKFGNSGWRIKFALPLTKVRGKPTLQRACPQQANLPEAGLPAEAQREILLRQGYGE